MPVRGQAAWGPPPYYSSWTAQLVSALLPSRTPIPHTPSHPNFLWGCPSLPEPLSLGLGYHSSGQLCGLHLKATESPCATRRYRLTELLGVGTLCLTLSCSAGEREAQRGAGPHPASQSCSVIHLSADPAPVQLHTRTSLGESLVATLLNPAEQLAAFHAAREGDCKQGGGELGVSCPSPNYRPRALRPFPWGTGTVCLPRLDGLECGGLSASVG